MKQAITDIAIAVVLLLAVLLAVDVAHAAPQTLEIVFPDTYADGTPLPAAARVGASIYCGPTTGRYVQAWGTRRGATAPPLPDVVTVEIDVRVRLFCAATAVAVAPDGVGEVESDMSTEFVRTANQPAAPLTVRSTTRTVNICTTTCDVVRSR